MRIGDNLKKNKMENLFTLIRRFNIHYFETVEEIYHPYLSEISFFRVVNVP